jgi:periplasmic divalent cation tolerance protein
MHIVVLITASSKVEAGVIAQALVKEKLAACVNIISNIESLFWWEGKVDRAKEWLLVAKSTKKELPKVIKAVRKLHSYKVPEIIALPIVGGFNLYLNWIDESLGRKS